MAKYDIGFLPVYESNMLFLPMLDAFVEYKVGNAYLWRVLDGGWEQLDELGLMGTDAETEFNDLFFQCLDDWDAEFEDWLSWFQLVA